MTRSEFDAWFSEEFGWSEDELVGNPLLVDDLGFDSWNFYILYCWILAVSGIDLAEGVGSSADLADIRIADVFELVAPFDMMADK